MNEIIDQLIQKSVLKLLKKKEYKDIQMKEIAEHANIGRRTLYRYYPCKDDIMDKIVLELMDNLAGTINQVNQMTIEGIAYAFFLFWENNMEEMTLLKKAHLIYLIEDNLPELVMGVSAKTKYKDLSSEEMESVKKQMTGIDYYHFCYMLAGYFRVAQIWMEEADRRSPEEMAGIMRKIVLREP